MSTSTRERFPRGRGRLARALALAALLALGAAPATRRRRPPASRAAGPADRDRRPGRAGGRRREGRGEPNQTPDWPEGIGFGLGVWSWDLPCRRRIYGHEGEVPGSNTWAFGSAAGRRTVVLQHNLFYMNWGRWADTVLPTCFSFWCEPA